MPTNHTGAFFEDDGPSTSLQQTVRIKKPADYSSRKIRNEILKADFGFTDAELADFNKAHPADLVIADTTKPNAWATVEQVRSWRTGSDGLVPIVLTDPWVSEVEAFRRQRASFEVYKVALFIDDAEVRKQFSEDAETILTASGETRMAALNNLMMLVTSGGKSQPAFYRALRFLTNESGYKNNPFLLLAFAGVTSYRSTQPSIGSPQVSQSQIDQAVAAANANLYNRKPRSSLTNISSMEVAAINNWANVLYTYSGNPEEASRRRWIDRFLSMSEEEKKQYKEGDIVRIYSEAEDSVRAPFDSEARRAKLEQEMQRKRQEWTSTDGIGSEQNIGMKYDHRQSDYFQRKDDLYPSKSDIKRVGDKAHSVARFPTEFKSVYSNVMGNGIGAGFTLIQEGTKWFNFNARMKVITEYLAKRQQLDPQVMRDNYRPVPPPPEAVDEAIRELRKNGRITRSHGPKRQLLGLMWWLEALREESYAYHKRR